MMTKKSREISETPHFRRKEQEVVVLSDRSSVYNLKSQVFLKKNLVAITYCFRTILTTSLNEVYQTHSKCSAKEAFL